MEQKTRGGRGFWYIWGSVLIKLGIAYLVYMAAVSLLAGVHLMQMTGGDADAMMQIAQSTAQSGKLYDQITNELMNWAVYIEGVAALITIPVMLFLFHRDSRKEKELGIVTEKASIWKYIAYNFCINHLDPIPQVFSKIMVFVPVHIESDIAR